jgi:hypothetical protein
MTEEERARHREYMRQYRLKNLERDRALRQAQGQRYWQENKETIVAKRKAKPRTDEDRARERAYMRVYVKHWRDKNPDKAAAAQKTYNAKHPRRGQELRKRVLERKAGRPKPSVCDICGLTNGRISFDHCHRTGEFRGWICSYCNVVLGYVKDDPDHLRKLIAYLEA